MQDIRKPYTRSRSSSDLQSRVEQFESARYRQNDDEDYNDSKPIQIPVRKSRRDIHEMDMYPRKRDDDYFYDDNDEDLDSPQVRKRLPVRDTRVRLHNRKNSFGTLAFVVSAAVIIIGVILYTYVFNSATITVVPKYKDINEIGRPFLFSKNGSDKEAVPFVTQSISVSKSKSLSPSESRKVEAKASGKIIIYNNYDSSVQKLIKNTRFESAKGKIYRINQSIEIPGKIGNTPGSIEVTVYADSNGAEYNVSETTFTIPGFKGSPREQAFYAKSKTPITGGSSGTMSLASLSDVNAAKDSLAVELAKNIEEQIATIKKEGYIPMYSAVEILYEDNEDEVLSGLTNEYKVTATGNLMLADESSLASVLAKTLSDYDNEPVRLIYTDTLSFTRKNTDRIANSTNTLSIFIEGKPRVVWDTDFEAIKQMVKGKKRDEFKPLMKSISSIESAEISFSPLWLSSFPGDEKKIIVNESLLKR